MTRIKDFKSYLSTRTGGRLSTQEIDAIADHKVIIDGVEMTVEEYHKQVLTVIFTYKREDGDRVKGLFSKEALLGANMHTINTHEGYALEFAAKEIGSWVVGKGQFGISMEIKSRSKRDQIEKPSKFDDTINNAIVVKSTWFDSDWADQLRIAIYLA